MEEDLCVDVFQDDEPALNFVAACSNIRAHVFGIAQKSIFDVKCE